MSDRVWRDTKAGPRLIGVTCGECRAKTFPISRMCRSCGSKNVEAFELASNGVVEAASEMMGLVLVNVRLDDGMLMMGQGASRDGLHIGTRVRFSPQNNIVRFIRDE